MKIKAEKLLVAIFDYGEVCFTDGRDTTPEMTNTIVQLRKDALNLLLAQLRTMTTEDLESL